MLKVTIVTPGFSEIPPGRVPAGIEEIDYQVAKQLSRSCEVTIISSFYSKFVKEKREGNLKISYVFHPAIRKDMRLTSFHLLIELFSIFNFSLLALFAFLRQKGSDVLIFSDRQSGLLPCLAAKIMGKEVIFSEGNSYPWYWSKYFRPSTVSRVATLLFGVFASRVSDKIRVQSASIRNAMVRIGIRAEKIRVIPGGVDTSLFRPQSKSESAGHDLVVGFVGRLTNEKGAPLLYEIAKRISLKFVVIGTGFYEKQLSSLKNARVVSSRSRVELSRLIDSCDIFVAPHPDPSLTILEEMSSGKPVIALDSPDMRTVVEHMSNGLLCKASFEEFCDAIETLSNNLPLRENLGRNARESALGYSWEKIGEKWLDFINSLEDPKGFGMEQS
jgi:glycosyltransferase involved in cell wall biosynthesis